MDSLRADSLDHLGLALIHLERFGEGRRALDEAQRITSSARLMHRWRTLARSSWWECCIVIPARTEMPRYPSIERSRFV